MYKKIIKAIKNPQLAILVILGEKCSRIIPDAQFLNLKYKSIVKKKLNLKEPKSFNEKIQWLKLYDRKPEYTELVDKYEVRKYIAEKIGEGYLIPLLGVYDTFDEIDFNSLPSQFVLKPNHTSGDVYICRDKSKIDYVELKKEVTMWLKRRYYWVHREWPYKNIKPRIVCEKYMVDESGSDLKDYKVFCFNGEPKMIQVDYNRFVDHKRNLYDPEWNYISASIHYPTDPRIKIKKPKRLEDILELAKVLARDYPHVRVDFYSINDQVYFGEMTFYHGSGYEKFIPESLGLDLGELIKLPSKR
ncbi:ATP-grasp fold amidoligase family protein [Priestia megaterium]|uniref:ATP-grasp fold amidoligase family protein n=1 Tax=Priestia megaterium TaxID=1404 RepID=UPI00196A6050|nr:ATP-grasp fold amidoligase family protein [Priestia megaterium]QSF40205.1 glycosyl transferase [Priestia megaterium]